MLVLRTYDVADGPSIGEPSGGCSTIKVDAVMREVGFCKGELQVVVVADFCQRVAEYERD